MIPKKQRKRRQTFRTKKEKSLQLFLRSEQTSASKLYGWLAPILPAISVARVSKGGLGRARD